MTDADPSKSEANDEKFKPHKVADELESRAPTDKRGAPADTEGYDVAHGSSGMTKKTPGS